MSSWAAVKYGWQPVYWLTVAGVPVLWTERALGLSTPADFGTVDAGLVIDPSAAVGSQVDRQKGIGVGLPLTFRLLDGANVASWMQKPAKRSNLTADLGAADTTAHVDDTSPWSANDYAQIGGERVKIGGVNGGASTLTGLTRATTGTLASKHRVTFAAQAVTDRPRTWLGREVVLWAVMVDQSGYAPGSAYTDDAIQVWRGRIDTLRRVDVGFEFTAQSLDRLLDQPLGAKISGSVIGQESLFAVSTSWSLSVTFDADKNSGAPDWSGTVTTQPFAVGYTDGQLITRDQAQAAISAGWDAGVTAAGMGANLGSMVWQVLPGNPTLSSASVWIKKDASTYWLEISDVMICGLLTSTDGTNGALYKEVFQGGMTKGVKRWLFSLINPCSAVVGFNGPSVDPGLASLAVQVDTDPSLVPSSGQIRVKAQNSTLTYGYSSTAVAPGGVYFVGLYPVGPNPVPLAAAGSLAGASVEVVTTATGKIASLLLQALESSGTAALRGSYDLLPQAAGYSLPSTVIDEASVLALVGAGSLGAWVATVSTSGDGVGALYGPLLALFRRAMVLRRSSDGLVRLTAVSTALGGSDWSTQIVDADLLSVNGDPLASVKRLDPPNRIVISRVTSGDDGADLDTVTLADDPSIEQEGLRDWALAVPCDSLAKLVDACEPAAAAMFAIDQTAQAVEIRVGPWVEAEPGDLVRLTVTHPGIWSWSNGAIGYDGVGRVVARTLELRSGVVRLTLLVDGAVASHSLAPSALISSFGGTAGNPTSVAIADKYQPHFAQALYLAQLAAVDLWALVYTPGKAEGVANYLKITGVGTPAGGLVQLTVTGLAGGNLTANQSRLTLPTSSPSNPPSITTYQAAFAHADDGSIWS